MSVGAERQKRATNQTQQAERDPALGLYLNAGGGVTYPIGDTQPFYGYAFWDGALRQGPDLEDNLAIGTGPSLGVHGYLGQSLGQWQLGAHHYRFLSASGRDHQHRETGISAAFAWNIDTDLQLRLQSRYLRARASENTDWQLGINWYY